MTDSFLFSGVVFDEFRFTQNSGASDSDYFTIEALAWEAVPEPSTALLIVLGLAGLRLRR